MHRCLLTLFFFPLLTTSAAQNTSRCPNGELHRRCRTDESCGHGNHCHETAMCCAGPAPSGLRRVHLCPADTFYAGTQPTACESKADCKIGSCIGRWLNPLSGGMVEDQGKVCCKAFNWRRRRVNTNKQ